MTDFNRMQTLVDPDRYQVEHALVIQGVRRKVEQLKRFQSTARPMRSATPARPQPAAARTCTAAALARGRVEAISLEGRCRQVWNQNAELRSEFLRLEQYTAYAKAIESGKGRIFGQETSRRPGAKREGTRSGSTSAAALIQQFRRTFRRE